jgi:hypothetical protein
MVAFGALVLTIGVLTIWVSVSSSSMMRALEEGKAYGGNILFPVSAPCVNVSWVDRDKVPKSSSSPTFDGVAKYLLLGGNNGNVVLLSADRRTTVRVDPNQVVFVECP